MQLTGTVRILARSDGVWRAGLPSRPRRPFASDGHELTMRCLVLAALIGEATT